MNEDKEYWIRKCAIAQADNSILQVKMEQLEVDLSRMREAMCIYAREELDNKLHGIDFFTDDEVVNYFLSFCEAPEQEKEK